MILEKRLIEPQMSFGVRITLSSVLGSLLREIPNNILNHAGNEIVEGIILDLKDPIKQHKIRTKIFPLPLTGEPQRVSLSETIIDGKKITKPVDLEIIGMDSKQIKILENNAENLDLLHKTRKDLRHNKPAILNRLEETFGVSIEHQYGIPGNFFNVLSSLPQQVAFILQDALGNIEGPYGSSLGSTMVGEKAGIYHSAIIGEGGHEQGNGWLPIPFVKMKKSKKMKYYGQIPKDLSGFAGELLNNGFMPIHPFNRDNFLNVEDVEEVQVVNCFVLMSKRALIPAGSDFQIKTSLGLRILAGVRDIRFTQAQNGIENSRVLNKLAERHQLPENCYIIADRFAGQVEGDNHTTYMVRNPWNEPIANNKASISETAIPITIASLFSKNVMSEVPLLQDFAEAGGDPIQLTKDAIKMVIETQLFLMNKGYVPEMHAQNTILLIDKNTMKLTGIMIRDHEGAKVDTEKMKEMGIQYYSVFNEAEDATSPLPLRKVSGETERKTNIDLYKKLVTGYLHRFVMTGIITPLILTANNRFPSHEMEMDVLAKYAKEIYMNWWKNKDESFKEYTDVVAPGYRASSGTLSALGVNIYSSSRSIETNPLIPTYDEMREFLSK